MGLLYTITILLNALLLFLVQPMIAKILLPYLGGTPSVWNTCMLFFQAMLLGGYGYAHVVTRRIPARGQILVHLPLLAAAALVFPIGISEEAVKRLDQGANPIGWLLAQLALSVGLPFFMLSTGGPLLQQWFSRTKHPAARDPYFLYSASNLGSLAALLGYPLLMEPGLRLGTQSRVWAIGYGILIAMIAGCAAWAGKNRAGQEENPQAAMHNPQSAITMSRRLRWILLSFAPSTLMLGVTTYLSTDISPIPLLWVAPLALYLMTFILAFAKRELLSLRLASRVLSWLGLMLAFPLAMDLHRPIVIMIPLHLLFFFLAAFLCHAQLARDRPSAVHLTEFYLWLSVGGVLGGLFNSLLAPNVFNSILEYPLAFILALLLRPGSGPGPVRAQDRWLDLLWPAGLGAISMAMFRFLPNLGLDRIRVVTLALALPCLIGFSFAARPVRFALFIAAMIWAGSANLTDYGKTLLTMRNFFGVLRVAEDRNGQFRQIYHGNTLHGRQSQFPEKSCEPLSYYHRRGPLGEALGTFLSGRTPQNIAVIGLGTGAMACYAGPEQSWSFYEIDPAVIEIAQDPRYFTYLTKCAPKPVQMITGDARLQLRLAPDQHYDLIVLDAFSSDAIPIHLLTRQAFALYLAKMKVGGRLLFHASNKYLDLLPVLGNLAADAQLVSLANIKIASEKEKTAGLDPSTWIVMTRTPIDLGSLSAAPGWKPLPTQSTAKVWMDDFSNIMGVLKWE
jgi:hypothetical protein